MLNIPLQIAITIFGILAIFLLSLKHKVRRYGFVVGLVEAGFWVIWILLTHNYIFLIFTGVRVLCYINGIHNYFLKTTNFLYRKTKKNRKLCKDCRWQKQVCSAVRRQYSIGPEYCPHWEKT